MDSVASLLYTSLKEYVLKSGSEEPPSILDFLFYNYLSSIPKDDGRISQCEKALSPVFEELSLESSDRLFDLIADLCAAYQRAAFIEGIQIGFQLTSELKAT